MRGKLTFGSTVEIGESLVSYRRIARWGRHPPCVHCRGGAARSSRVIPYTWTYATDRGGEGPAKRSSRRNPNPSTRRQEARLRRSAGGGEPLDRGGSEEMLDEEADGLAAVTAPPRGRRPNEVPDLDRLQDRMGDGVTDHPLRTGDASGLDRESGGEGSGRRTRSVRHRAGNGSS